MTQQTEWQAFTLAGRSPKVLICSIIVLSISRLSIIGELIKAKRILWEMNLLLDAGVTSIPEHKRCEGSLFPLRDCGENVHQKPNNLESSCLSHWHYQWQIIEISQPKTFIEILPWMYCSEQNFEVVNYHQCDGTVQQDKITRPLISRSVWNILRYFMIPPMLWSSLTRLTHLSYPARFESMKGWLGSLMDACKEEKANALWKGLAYEEPLVDDCV